VDSLAQQVDEFQPEAVCIGSSDALADSRDRFRSVQVYEGVGGLESIVRDLDFDILLNALVGSVGLRPTVAALKRGKRVALANKESLVVGGELINELIDNGGGTLIPVDSEHSAIFQCLNGEDTRSVEKLILTASGGPFRDMPREEFCSITPEQALDHPTWAMGKKITIDSATLINKGFELIEAHHLFRVPYDKLDVVIHPQSIVHSMVVFRDGAVLAECGVPDMELPIQYALSYPERFALPNNRLDLTQIGSLSFAKPDRLRFPGLELCVQAGVEGGTMPTVLNAANEIAVELFLKGAVGFNGISDLIRRAMDEHKSQPCSSIETIEGIDHQTRRATFLRAEALS
jgi:1-deoxy-D-xylulose-5-phosphate reductoisomerase